MGASPLLTFFRVTVPLIAPGLITAAMIGFTSAATTFVVPQILGANQPTASLYIFRDVGKIGFTPWIAVEVLVMDDTRGAVSSTTAFQSSEPTTPSSARK